MNVWGWVTDLQQQLDEDGQGHLAYLIDELPYAASIGDPRAEAIAPELLAAAEALDHPWLAIYTRHWHIQYLVGTHNQGTVALSTVADAFERAHRPEAEGCPQSICTTQDMSMVYEAVDHLGFAKDREAVCRETIADITPTWSCFDCLHRELADSLADQGRVDDARHEVERSIADMRAAGEEPALAYRGVEVRIENLSGKFERAVELGTELDGNDDELPLHRTRRNLELATALRHLGRLDEAIERFPSASDVLDERTQSGAWAIEYAALVGAGALENDAAQAAVLQVLLDHSLEVGSLRTTIDVGHTHGMLAAGRGARWVADLAADAMELARAELPADHGAAAKIAEVRQAAAAALVPPMPVPAGELMAFLEEGETSFETDVVWLRQAAAELPDDPQPVFALAIALKQAGHHKELGVLFEELVDHAIMATPLVPALAHQMISSELGRSEVSEALERASKTLTSDPSIERQFGGHRLGVEHAMWQGRWDDAVGHGRAALERRPDARETKGAVATAAREAGDYELARDLLLSLIDDSETDDEVVGHSWALLTPATCLDDWTLVRELATRLELPMSDGDGPIDIPMEFCQVVLTDENGGFRQFAALRSGPVTARILEVSHPSEDEQVFDLNVIVAATPLNLDDRERLGNEWVPVFGVVETRPGRESNVWMLDGPGPTMDAWNGFRQTLQDDGWGVWAAPWDDYQVADPNQPGEFVLGIFLYIAAPAALSPAEVHERLSEVTASFEHPLAWPDLAEAAGVDHAAHLELAAKYDL